MTRIGNAWPRGLTVVLVLAVLLPSCIGAMRVYAREIRLKSPVIDGKQSDVLRSTDGPPTTTAAEVEAMWGRPATITVGSDGTEMWEYPSDDSFWTGVVLALVVIPLPLLAPVGRDEVNLSVRDGLVVEATASLGDTGVAWFGLVWDDEISRLKVGSVLVPSTFRDVPVRLIALPWCGHSSPSKVDDR